MDGTPSTEQSSSGFLRRRERGQGYRIPPRRARRGSAERLADVFDDVGRGDGRHRVLADQDVRGHPVEKNTGAGGVRRREPLGGEGCHHPREGVSHSPRGHVGIPGGVDEDVPLGGGDDRPAPLRITVTFSSSAKCCADPIRDASIASIDSPSAGTSPPGGG